MLFFSFKKIFLLIILSIFLFNSTSLALQNRTDIINNKDITNITKNDNNNNNNNNIKYETFINNNKQKLKKLVNNLFIDKQVNIGLNKSLLDLGYLTPFEYLQKIKNNYLSNLVYYWTLESLFKNRINFIKSQNIKDTINSEKNKKEYIYYYLIDEIKDKIQKIIINIQKQEDYIQKFLIKLKKNEDYNLNKLTSFFGNNKGIYNYISKFKPFGKKENKIKYYKQIIKDANLKKGWELNKELNYENLGININKYIPTINNKIELNIIDSKANIDLLTKNKIDKLNPILKDKKHLIKLASIIGPRKLNKGRRGYHLGIDITLADLNQEINRNCSFIDNKDVLSFLDKSSFNKEKCLLNKQKLEQEPNYKDLYNIIISLDIKNLYKNNNQCYIGIHHSLYSQSRLVGYGHFILCQTNNYLWNLYGHTNITTNQINSLIKQGYLTPVNYGTNYIKLTGLMNGFYQTNYLTFNKSKLSWDGPAILQWDRSLLLPNKVFYKINYNKILNDGFEYLNIPYGNTGFSFGKHIHYALLYQLGEFVSPVGQTSLLLKIISKQLGLNLSLKDNYYYFGWTNY